MRRRYGLSMLRIIARPVGEGLAVLALTATIVAVVTQAALANLDVNSLTLSILMRGSDPFRELDVPQATAVAIGRSGALLAVALAAATLVGIGAGVAYALSASRMVRGLSWAVGTVGVSLPSFFWAMVLQLAVVLFYVRTEVRFLPTSGFGIDEHLVLPAIAIAARPAAYLFRTTATALEEVRHDDYVRSARAKGLLEAIIARRHIFPNAAPAVVSGFGIAARSALSSLAIVEYVFSWNGAGFGFIHSIATDRAELAIALAVAFAVVFTLVAVAVQVLSRAMDPRRS